MRVSLLLLACLIAGVSTPAAAAAQTAVCRDGSYSYSQHRSGTCSHHGGVARWMSGDTDRSPVRTAKPQDRKTSLSTAPSPRRTSRGTPRPARRPAARHTRRSAARSSAASRGYYTGPRGGCYTYTASGRKRYVDHSFCG